MNLHWYKSLNLKKSCAEYRVGLWQCPQFLFLIMGGIIIVAILTTYISASKYQNPEMVALAVLVLSAGLFLIGYLVVNAFEHVALASKSKSEFISIMSHQLRSPLSAIKWQLNLLLQDSASAASTQPQSSFLEAIAEQNERMIQAVNDLLEVNRIEDNDLILRPLAFSIKNLTEKLAQKFQKYAAAYNIRVSVLIDNSLPMVYADEEKIGHAMEHLIDNAVRYSIQGGNITISAQHDHGKIIWKISDKGHGIPFEEQNKVFQKFFRSPNAARFQTEGSGTGLFVSRAIIEASGGKIGFTSAPEKGSTFWFSLPISKKN